jgi:hypothetical protein
MAVVLSLLSLVGVFRGGSGDVESVVSSGPLFTPSQTLFASVESNEAFLLGEYKSTANDPEASNLKSRSDTWSGKFREGNLTLQITQPIAGWIEIARGYKSSGWEIIDRDNSSVELGLTNEQDSQNPANRRTGNRMTEDDPDSENNEEATEQFNAFATARMRSSDGSGLEGYLYYSAVDRNGAVVETPTSLSSIWQSLERRLGMENPEDTQPVAMIQLLLVTPEKLSPRDIRTLKREFVKHRDAVVEAIKGNTPVTKDPGLKEQVSATPSYTSASETQS